MPGILGGLGPMHLIALGLVGALVFFAVLATSDLEEGLRPRDLLAAAGLFLLAVVGTVLKGAIP